MLPSLPRVPVDWAGVVVAPQREVIMVREVSTGRSEMFSEAVMAIVATLLALPLSDSLADYKAASTSLSFARVFNESNLWPKLGLYVASFYIVLLVRLKHIIAYRLIAKVNGVSVSFHMPRSRGICRD